MVGDTLMIETQGNNSKLSMTLLKIPEVTIASCTVEEPVESSLVRIGSCSIDTNNAVKDGVFTAPSDGVYKLVYNGVMKVVGEGKVHANILKKSSNGKLETQVAGFVRYSSQISNDLYGALLASSQSITAYTRYFPNHTLLAKPKLSSDYWLERVYILEWEGTRETIILLQSKLE